MVYLNKFIGEQKQKQKNNTICVGKGKFVVVCQNGFLAGDTSLPSALSVVESFWPVLKSETLEYGEGTKLLVGCQPASHILS